MTKRESRKQRSNWPAMQRSPYTFFNNPLLTRRRDGSYICNATAHYIFITKVY
ncbi:hypothetical protein [Porphyromonas pogonae]|uniref:hypothetical protein n=1 Tax=Porphyromonas pogonae TaxID=867595 RepID=UPI002E795E06|nr:hypothetical protein [Porphyromonas pogonae]